MGGTINASVLPVRVWLRLINLSECQLLFERGKRILSDGLERVGMHARFGAVEENPSEDRAGTKNNNNACEQCPILNPQRQQ